MKITKDMVPSIAYEVRTEDGVLVDEATATAPLEYLHGAGNLIEGLESALEGKKVGDKFDVDVDANHAYGEYNDALVQNVQKEFFVGVDDLAVGMRFVADTEQGQIPVEITAIDGDIVTVDGNHILAGQNIKFNVEVIGIREATEEEKHHGHIHSNHGCCGGHGAEEKEDCCGGNGENKGCGCHH